ncbi:SRPBCC family protein [Soonwooa sp.]|uniref:SRPBCC family protein n=1 Tax=Soonwooa sp. TaxID=1938592 RepID=UPI0028AE50B7|nr:SRPBCC family protein [Soonwooa sp.]
MEHPIFVQCQMLIRKPIAEVFEAFVNPEITTKFWFTKSSGKLEEGTTTTWTWEMYNVSSEVQTLKIVPNQKIETLWGNPATNVDYEFQEMKNGTLVIIKSYDYPQTGDDLAKVVNDNTGGFTTVLDGCKAWLEHGIKLNLIEDKFPAE